MAIKNRFIHFKTRAGFDSNMPNPTDSTHDYYNYLVFIKDTKEIYTHGQFYASEMPYITGTYSQIVNLADSGKLKIGRQYVITNYTYIVRDGYGGQFQSGAHVFGIILTPISPYEFSEDARAINTGDSYFNSCNLSEWRLKYTIKNDTSRHGWASTNGRGVIYWMRDEFGNEAGYDFKNIRFFREYIDLTNYLLALNGTVVFDGASYSDIQDFQDTYGITFPTAMRYAAYETKRTGSEFTSSGLATEGNKLSSSVVYAMYDVKGAFPGNIFIKTGGLSTCFCYTFTYIPSVSSSYNNIYDATVASATSSFRPRNNIIEEAYHSSTGSSSLYKMRVLYDNVFIMNGAVSPYHCYENVLKEGARCNTIEGGSHHNIIENKSHHNIIGEQSSYNHIGSESQENIITRWCHYNTIGINSNKNILWDGSTHNSFGTNCLKCFALKKSTGNIWDSNCYSSGIIFNYSTNNIFRSGSSSILEVTSSITGSESNILKNIDVQAGCSSNVMFTDVNRTTTTFVGNSKGNITKSSSATIYPGEHTVITYSGSAMNVTLGKTYSAMPFTADEYSFEFTVGSTVPTLSITSGSTIIWANGDTPVLESGYKYEISVRNNLAVYAQYEV